MALVNIVLNEDQREGTQALVSQWLYEVGDIVEKNQPIVELETDKVMMEVIAPVTGKLSEILLDVGEQIFGENVLGLIDANIKYAGKKDDNVSTNTMPPVNKPTVIESKSDGLLMSKSISPSVRRLCKEYDLNVSQIQGSGKDQRVTSRDVLSFLQNKPQNVNVETSAQLSEHLPISNMRQSIANHMVDSLLKTAPHVTSIFSLDLSAIITHRKKHKQQFLEQGVHLTFTTYFIAASVVAIKQVPLINAQLHDKTIEVFNNINIGIGTALADKGLIVPVIKNCENQDLFSIASKLSDLTSRARNNQLKPSDVKDGTFTISNHGVSGSLIATPIIINQPQSAILGIGKMEKRVIVKEVDGDDIMVIKPMCYVTLTIDHRILDAHQTNQFLSVFVDTLQQWS